MDKAKPTPGPQWNQRYIAYAQAQGFADPAQALEHDRAVYPGGCMCNFMCWVSNQWKEWELETGFSGIVKNQIDHDNFDEWLAGGLNHPKANLSELKPIIKEQME